MPRPPARSTAAACVCVAAVAFLTGCSPGAPRATEPELRISSPPAVFVLPGDATGYTQPGTPVYFDAPPYDEWTFTSVPDGLASLPGVVTSGSRTPPSVTASVPGVYRVVLENSSTGEFWTVTLSVTPAG